MSMYGDSSHTIIEARHTRTSSRSNSNCSGSEPRPAMRWTSWPAVTCPLQEYAVFSHAPPRMKRVVIWHTRMRTASVQMTQRFRSALILRSGLEAGNNTSRACSASIFTLLRLESAFFQQKNLKHRFFQVSGFYLRSPGQSGLGPNDSRNSPGHARPDCDPDTDIVNPNLVFHCLNGANG